jgi:hypothetical protein
MQDNGKQFYVLGGMTAGDEDVVIALMRDVI